MKNVLVITYSYLHGSGGGVFASQAFINAVAELSEKITVICPQKNGSHPEKMNSNINFVFADYDIPLWRKIVLRLSGHLHFMANVFIHEIKKGNYDTVIFNSSLCSYGLIDIAKQSGCKIITIHHNFEQEYFRDNFNGLMGKWLLWLASRAERESVMKSDLGLTLTPEDRELLIMNYDSEKRSKIKVLGCFENIGREHPSINNEDSGNNRFVITGTLSAIQSQESLFPWINTYYPILKQICPSSTLTIAGRDPSEELLNLCKQNGITVIPNPKDMSDVLNKADYFICPTSLGGGLKLRIMDGLSAGLPVITHKVSARGYESFRDSCLYVYDDVKSFRQELISMINNTHNRNSIQTKYLATFSYVIGVKRLGRLIEENL